MKKFLHEKKDKTDGKKPEQGQANVNGKQYSTLRVVENPHSKKEKKPMQC